MQLKIGILSTRGIPNRYGGFEQLAEYLSVGLVKKGHEVMVYNSHRHPYKEKKWNGVSIVHCYDPEDKIGTAGQFIYDLNCLLDARKRKLDVLLIFGYTSISIWVNFFPEKSTVIFNMDGLEWKRSKYSSLAKRFLLRAETLALKSGDYFISDSVAIQKYYQKKYNIASEYIAYGAEIHTEENASVLSSYNLEEKDYCLIVARMEPENNIEMILNGLVASNTKKKIVVIGDVSKKFGRFLTRKFHTDNRVQFIGSLYDKQAKHTLCHFSQLYFHGHSTGGTNPSLLEAMASGALIAAHDNEFNKEVLGENGFYFGSPADVKKLIESDTKTGSEKMIQNNYCRIKAHYNWCGIIDQYENFIVKSYMQKNQ